MRSPALRFTTKVTFGKLLKQFLRLVIMEIGNNSTYLQQLNESIYVKLLEGGLAHIKDYNCLHLITNTLRVGLLSVLFYISSG